MDKDTSKTEVRPSTAEHRPGWKTTEFWLSLAAVAIGAVLAYGLLDKYETWARLLGAALAVLSSLGYTASRTAVKKAAHRVVPPLAILLLLGATSGCATWKDTTLRSLATAQAVGVEAHAVARVTCRPTLKACIARRENPCEALQTCQAKRDPVLRSLDSLQRAVIVGTVAVETSSESGATMAVASALRAAGEVCAGLATWKVAPKVCQLLAGGTR